MITEFKTLKQLVEKFSDEKSAVQFLATQRWSDGVIVCPHCENEKSYVFSDGLRYKCAKCRKQFTATTGTPLESSKLPLINWFMAIWLILHKKGISSYQLAKDLGITQKSAWFLLQRIRLVFDNDSINEIALNGQVQLDETFVGGKNKNRHADKKVANSQGRSFKDKTPVMGMMQDEVSEIVPRERKIIANKIVKEKVIKAPAIVRCKVIANTQAKTLQPVLKENIAAGSIVISDEWQGYTGISVVFNHQIVDHTKKQYVNAEGYSSNRMEGFWTGLKLGIQATYHGVKPKHLNKYTQEFVFKYNYRNLDMQSQIVCILKNMKCRMTYKQLIAS